MSAAGEELREEPWPLRWRVRRGLRTVRHAAAARLDAFRYRLGGAAFDPSVTTVPFLVTGPPRSGTSLTTSLLNRKRNVIVVNEPVELAERRLRHVDFQRQVPGYLADVQRRAVREGVVLTKADPDDPRRPATDTWYQSWEFRPFQVEIDRERPLCVGAKQPMPFLERLAALCDAWPELRAIVVVRDPFATLASWQRTFKALRDFGPGSFVSQFSFYRRIPQEGSLLEKQARLLRVMTDECLALGRRDAVLLVRYEDLLREPARVLERMLRHIGAPDPAVVPDVSDVAPRERDEDAFSDAEHAVIRREMRLAEQGASC